jgi:hypothetical protein
LDDGAKEDTQAEFTGLNPVLTLNGPFARGVVPYPSGV